MKIHQIRIQNINSIAGEWLIDLEDARILQEGIFAIVGATGAGKSTLLDAICLALFGQTPRLGRLTASSNEAMTRGTGICVAELEFSVKNVRYMARWSQSRAKKNAEKSLQAPQHSLVDMSTMKPIEDKLSRTMKVVEKVTGLDFDRFTLTMMLAQGSFAKFLQAKDDERGALLEEITGTGIYRSLSIRSHEKAVIEERKIEELRSKLEGFTLFLDEERVELEQFLKDQELNQQQLEMLLERFRGQIISLKELSLAEAHLRAQTTVKNAAELALKEFKSQGLLLADSERAYRILPVLRRWEEKAVAMKENQELLQACEVELEQGRGEEVKATASFALEQKKKTELESFLKDRRQILAQVREMDTCLVPLHEAKLGAEKRYVETARYCREQKEILLITQKNLATHERLIGDLQFSLDQWAPYLDLNEKLAGIVSQVESWRREQDAYDRLIERKVNASSALLKENDDLSVLQKSLETAELSMDQVKSECRDMHDKLCAGWHYLNISLPEKEKQRALAQEAERLSMEAWKLKQVNARQAQIIEDYHNARAHLEENHECPLCGALDHPFVSKGTPKPVSQLDLEQAESAWSRAKTKVSLCDMEIQALKQHLKTWQEYLAVQQGEAPSCLAVSVSAMQTWVAEQRELSVRLEALERDCQRERDAVKEAQVHIQGLKKDIDEISQQCREKTHLLEVLKLRVKNDLAEFNQHVAVLGEADEALAYLENRKNQLKSLQEEMLKKTKEKDALSTQSESLKLSVQKLLSDESTMQEEKDLIDSEYQSQWLLRQKLYGDSDPSLEADSLSLKEDAFMRSWQNHEKALNQFRLKVHGLGVQYKGLKELISKETFLLALAAKEWLGVRSEGGFVSDVSYRAALLDEEQHQLLKEQSLRLHKDREDAVGIWNTLKLQYEDCIAKNTGDASLAELEGIVAEHDAQRSAILREIGATRERLARDQEQRTQQLSLLQQLKIQREHAQVWIRLKELIGSNDGKLFSVFAQGLTLDVLLYHANLQLKQLSPRYQLVRDEQSKLDLLVRDRELGWETRSCTNLSGGESFLVSLALALGLSHLASENIRVDSLFLDEGFGTLDAQSLDTALDALSHLRRHGKIIGVISHVEALKNRIPAQISIVSGINGRSSLEGVGISRL